MEAWKSVPAFSGYQVSDAGRVFGPKGQTLKPIKCRQYLRVCLSEKGRRRNLRKVAKPLAASCATVRQIRNDGGHWFSRKLLVMWWNKNNGMEPTP